MASLCVPSLAFTQSDTSIDTTRNLFTRVAALVRINGQGPFRFVIDTGAQRSAVADTVASALALPAGPSVMIHGITSATLNSTAQVARLALANETFRNIQAPVLPLEQLGAHGLIGLDVLARFRVGFDTVGRRVTLMKPGGFRVVEGSAQIAGSNIRRRPSKSIRQRLGQLLLTDTLAENVPVAAFIDTGAQYSIGNLALQRSIGAPTAGLATRPLSIRVYGVTGESLLADAGALRSLRLGRNRLGFTPMLFADLHCFDFLDLSTGPAILIGGDLISRFRSVTLDFPAATIDFDRPLRA